MEHELKPKMYCVPANEEEHETVAMVGRWTGALSCGMAAYKNGHAIMFHKWGVLGTCSPPALPDGAWFVRCADFIAALYRMAEKRKASPESQAAQSREQSGYMLLEDRVKELEENARAVEVDLLAHMKHISNLATALNEHMVNFREHIHIIDRKGPNCFTATEIPLEGRYPAAGAGDQVTNDEQVRYARNAPENCCCTILDVGASPKDIPFEMAFAFMKANRAVRRASWLPGITLHNQSGNALVTMSALIDRPKDWEPHQADLLATDWEVVEP